MIKSLISSILIIFCATIIELAILSNISVLIVVPDLILICSIYFSLLNGRGYGVTTGFVSGVILDFATGVPFGFNCLLRLLIGYFYGFFSNFLIVSGILMPMLSVAIGTIAKNLLSFLVNFLYPNIHLNIPHLISNDFLFELVANIILAPIIFKFLGIFKNALSLKTIQDKVSNARKRK